MAEMPGGRFTRDEAAQHVRKAIGEHLLAAGYERLADLESTATAPAVDAHGKWHNGYTGLDRHACHAGGQIDGPRAEPRTHRAAGGIRWNVVEGDDDFAIRESLANQATRPTRKDFRRPAHAFDGRIAKIRIAVCNPIRPEVRSTIPHGDQSHRSAGAVEMSERPQTGAPMERHREEWTRLWPAPILVDVPIEPSIASCSGQVQIAVVDKADEAVPP